MKRRERLLKLLWMLGLYVAGLLVMGAAAWLIRAVMRAVGLVG